MLAAYGIIIVVTGLPIQVHSQVCIDASKVLSTCIFILVYLAALFGATLAPHHRQMCTPQCTCAHVVDVSAFLFRFGLHSTVYCFK